MAWVRQGGHVWLCKERWLPWLPSGVDPATRSKLTGGKFNVNTGG